MSRKYDLFSKLKGVHVSQVRKIANFNLKVLSKECVVHEKCNKNITFVTSS